MQEQEEKELSGLAEKIRSEMVVDYSEILDKNLELAKHLIRITDRGTVEVPQKSNLSAKERIMLYLIGKLYAKEAKLSEIESAGNQEIMEELNMPEGTLLPRLKELRDSRQIKQVKVERYVHHKILPNWIEVTLKDIEAKLSK